MWMMMARKLAVEAAMQKLQHKRSLPLLQETKTPMMRLGVMEAERLSQQLH
jgi:hypothetical protein